MAELLFNLINLMALPVWVCMLLFPKLRFTQRLVSAFWYYLPFAALYLLALSMAVATGIGSLAFDFRALQGAIAREWGVVAVWAHLVVADLFVGVWIFRDAKHWQIRPTWHLILTLLAAPVGLASYLWRRRRAKGGRLLN